MTAKARLGVDHPILLAELVQPDVEASRISEGGQLPAKLKLALSPSRFQKTAQLAPEQTAEDSDGGGRSEQTEILGGHSWIGCAERNSAPAYPRSALTKSCHGNSFAKWNVLQAAFPWFRKGAPEGMSARSGCRFGRYVSLGGTFACTYRVAAYYNSGYHP